MSEVELQRTCGGWNPHECCHGWWLVACVLRGGYEVKVAAIRLRKGSIQLIRHERNLKNRLMQMD